MNQQEFLAAMRRGESVAGSTEGHEWMHKLADQAQQLTAQLNGSYHTPEEIRQIMSEITGKPVDETFRLFPPFIPTAEKTSPSAKMCLSTVPAIFRTREASPSKMAA